MISKAALFGVCVGIAALLATGLASHANSYADVPDVRSGDATAIALDPNDPVPQIGSRCDDGCGYHCHDRCGHERHYCHDNCEPVRCHEDCWRERCDEACWHKHYDCRDNCEPVRDLCHDDCEHEHHDCRDNCEPVRDDCHHDCGWQDSDTSLVDCSGLHPHAYRSVSEAAMHTPPNGRILILPPDPGMTCVETVQVPGPVTIVSAGPTRAVIEAPPHQPCLIANIPLGDTLRIENVEFIARGEDEPCVKVQAGTVSMDNVRIDSRNTDWAFDVAESGALRLSDSRIETDGSGVKSSRADVELKNVEIDVEERAGKESAGLALDRTDGSVDGGRIIGGKTGAWMSSGPHGLAVNGLNIEKSDRALVIHDGEQGVVSAQGLEITNSLEGILVSPGTEVRLDSISIEGSRDTAVSLYGGRAELSGSHISRAGVGIVLAPQSSWRPDFWERLFHCEHVLPESPEDYLLGKHARITGNEIADVAYGFDLNDGGPALIAGNSITARRECFEGDGHHIDMHDNRCRD